MGSSTIKLSRKMMGSSCQLGVAGVAGVAGGRPVREFMGTSGPGSRRWR